MPKSQENVNLDLEDLLSSKGFDVTSLDSSGKQLPTANNADVQTFHFHRDGQDYGTVTVSIDGLKNMIVYYDDEIANSGVNEDDMDADRGMNGTSWISLVKQLKKFAQRHQLGFVLKDTDRLRTDMKRRQQTKKLEEGKVKELKMDLKDMTDDEFKKAYKMTKAEARAELKPKKKVAEDDAGDVEQRFAAKMEKEKQRLAQLKKTDPEAYQREMEKRKTSSRIPPVSTFEAQGVAANTQTKLDEGYYGNRKMSYNDAIPEVKMVIKHNKQIEETDQRFRHIEKIFLETSDGERFSVPTNKPSRARMFARHIAEGGGYKDERWSHLNEICEDLDSLGGFIRATRSSDQFNESAQRMIGEAVSKYHELRETARRLQGGRGYNSYFESYEPAVKNDNDDDLLEVFKHSSVDSRIEKALPTLNKLGIRRGKLEEADMFEQWADTLIDESLDIDGDRQSEAIIELFADEIPVGPNAEVAIGELADVIEDDDLYARLRRTATVNPNSDARPQIIAWMQEQEGSKYRELLAKLETDDSDSAEDQEELKKSDKSDSVEPEKVQPKKKKPAPDAGGMGGLPPLPGGDMGGLPPLPPLPPLKEADDVMASFKRLLGL